MVHQVYCSPRCYDRVQRDDGNRSRARRFGVPYEQIDPIEVFGRDRWRCQICGRKTPKSRRGTLADNAPELEHRIPMALGGPHTMANVQCACRRCNMAKGARRVVGQLPLWDAPAAV